jgi:nicotinamide-nucleotide amidase
VNLKNDEIEIDPTDVPFRIDTDPEIVRSYLSQNNGKTKIIFSTYQSSEVVSKATKGNFEFDVAVFDEAHKTTGSAEGRFAFGLKDENIKIKKRLFLTATPKHYDISKRNKDVSAINKKQAEVPFGCKVIRNKNGTAPGMWMEKNNVHFISMPGVPYEMKGMMLDDIIPEFKKMYQLPFIYHKTILTQGIGESVLCELISDWEDGLSANNIGLAYLPSPGMVRLRLSCKGFDEIELKNKIDLEIQKLTPLIEKFIYGQENYGEKQSKLEEILGKLLLDKKLKLGLAESCTGGYISHLITSVSGSSSYFNGCVVPYHNEFKHSLLNVDQSVFETSGAVSKDCVTAMVKQTLIKFNADVAIAVSGIAGPNGGTSEKPVGTTWIAVAYNEKIITKQFVFGDNRLRNIETAAITSMNMLRKLILNIED